MALATDARDDAEADQFGHGGSAIQRIGAVIAGSYRLTRHIGSGGSSHVFEADHLRLGKSFAVKLLRPELDPNRRTAQRFRREARAIARLKSEHIVSVVDCGELDDGTPYLVMELLEGEDLRSLLNREGSLPARRAVALIVEACRGLSEVHAAGLVHRDLKPENLFITKRSTGEDWCKVLDFGVAKMEASSSTAQGAIIGTLRYMAPEQLEASSLVSQTTDVYALGAILYECLCGQPAHPGNTAQEVMYSVMNRSAPAAPLQAASVPVPLVEAVMSCLAKRPQLRPRAIAELAETLSRSVALVMNDTSPTLNEDDSVARSRRSAPQAPVSRYIPWTASAAALAVAVLIGWAGGATTASHAPSAKLATALRGAAGSAASASSSSVPPTIAPAAAMPAKTVSAGPATSPISTRMSDTRNRPVPKPTVARSSPTDSAQPPHVAVGRFDPANPYGE